MTDSVGPYRVLRKIGSGGMGDVYLADDSRLDRRVALKCPSDEWLKAPDARLRLQREARAAAQLTHPNIAGVFDVIEDAGRPYIVMEYVDGESLSVMLRRGPLRVERALAIGTQVADGLAAAHAAGVIHRDLKPGNVMVTPDGRVKLLDFGLAKTVAPGAEPLTSPGQVLGTPGYVAPEQLLGRGADQRSDIFSAGALLYHLLSGRGPWDDLADRGQGVGALLAPIPDLRSVSPSVPPAVSQIVMRALARDPKDRYQRADALRDALASAAASLGDIPTVPSGTVMRRSRRPALVVAVLVCALAAAAGIPWLMRWRTSTPVTVHSLPVIAVLPFETLTSDASLQYLGTGMADTVSTKLASVAGLAVVPRAEIHEALQRTPDVSAVSRALGAAFLVNGSVQQSGGRVQVIVNLLSPDGRRIVSADRFEDSADHLFALQRQIAEMLARRVVGSLSAADAERIARNPAATVDALAAYWSGRDLLEQPGPQQVDAAIAAFLEATRADASFALGHAGLASAYARKYAETHDPQWSPKAIAAAERARALDALQPEVRYALAAVYHTTGRDDAAIAELKEALLLQPADEAAHRMLGDVYASLGRSAEAVSEYHEAMRIRPDFWAAYRALGIDEMRAGHYDEATRAFSEVTRLLPDSPIGYQLLGTVQATTVDLPGATLNYEAAIARGGTYATYSALGTVYYLQRRFDDAVGAYKKAIELRPKSATTYRNLGDACRRAGRDADARGAYETAVRLFEADLAVNPADAVAIARRASCLVRIGRTHEAAAEIARADRLGPDNQDVQYHRALVSTLLGQRAAAVDAVQRAVRAGYSVALLRVDDDLASLRGDPAIQSIMSAAPAAARRQ